MTKKELIDRVAADLDITKKLAADALMCILDNISSALAEGDKVTFVGFGTFSVVERKERKGINPQTKAEITIPARTVPKFKAGKALKNAVR